MKYNAYVPSNTKSIESLQFVSLKLLVHHVAKFVDCNLSKIINHDSEIIAQLEILFRKIFPPIDGYHYNIMYPKDKELSLLIFSIRNVVSPIVPPNIENNSLEVYTNIPSINSILSIYFDRITLLTGINILELDSDDDYEYDEISWDYDYK